MKLKQWDQMEEGKSYRVSGTNMRVMQDDGQLFSMYPMESMWHPFYPDSQNDKEVFDKCSELELEKIDFGGLNL